MCAARKDLLILFMFWKDTATQAIYVWSQKPKALSTWNVCLLSCRYSIKYKYLAFSTTSSISVHHPPGGSKNTVHGSHDFSSVPVPKTLPAYAMCEERRSSKIARRSEMASAARFPKRWWATTWMCGTKIVRLDETWVKAGINTPHSYHKTVLFLFYTTFFIDQNRQTNAYMFVFLLAPKT